MYMNQLKLYISARNNYKTLKDVFPSLQWNYELIECIEEDINDDDVSEKFLVKLFQLLIDAKVFPFPGNKTTTYYLYDAVFNERYKLAKLLLEKGEADIEHVDEKIYESAMNVFLKKDDTSKEFELFRNYLRSKGYAVDYVQYTGIVPRDFLMDLEFPANLNVLLYKYLREEGYDVRHVKILKNYCIAQIRSNRPFILLDLDGEYYLRLIHGAGGPIVSHDHLLSQRRQ